MGTASATWIQAGRFAGTDKAAILDHVRLDMHPVQAIEEAVSFVEEALRARGRHRPAPAPGSMEPAPAGPRGIINAVVHADYSQRGAPTRVAIFDDRLEVENPGLLPFGVTLEDLPFGSPSSGTACSGESFTNSGWLSSGEVGRRG